MQFTEDKIPAPFSHWLSTCGSIGADGGTLLSNWDSFRGKWVIVRVQHLAFQFSSNCLTVAPFLSWKADPTKLYSPTGTNNRFRRSLELKKRSLFHQLSNFLFLLHSTPLSSEEKTWKNSVDSDPSLRTRESLERESKDDRNDFLPEIVTNPLFDC